MTGDIPSTTPAWRTSSSIVGRVISVRASSPVDEHARCRFVAVLSQRDQRAAEQRHQPRRLHPLPALPPHAARQQIEAVDAVETELRGLPGLVGCAHRVA
jgi:hypothetical protein